MAAGGRNIKAVSKLLGCYCAQLQRRCWAFRTLPHSVDKVRIPGILIGNGAICEGRACAAPDSVRCALQSFEIPKAVHLSAEEWTPENGMLTPTFKIKREIVKRKFEAELEALYQQLKKTGRGKKPAAKTIDVHSRTK